MAWTSKEKKAAYNKAYYEKRKAELQPRHRQWYYDNAERAKAYQREYQKAHYKPHPKEPKPEPTPEEVAKAKEKKRAYYRERNNRPEMKEYRHQRYLAQKAKVADDA